MLFEHLRHRSASSLSLSLFFSLSLLPFSLISSLVIGRRWWSKVAAHESCYSSISGTALPLPSLSFSLSPFFLSLSSHPSSLVVEVRCPSKLLFEHLRHRSASSLSLIFSFSLLPSLFYPPSSLVVADGRSLLPIKAAVRASPAPFCLLPLSPFLFLSSSFLSPLFPRR
ncbi:hypothetical protein ACOSP7_026957 [Xanthoceras sorbifolium]